MGGVAVALRRGADPLVEGDRVGLGERGRGGGGSGPGGRAPLDPEDRRAEGAGQLQAALGGGPGVAVGAAVGPGGGERVAVDRPAGPVGAVDQGGRGRGAAGQGEPGRGAGGTGFRGGDSGESAEVQPGIADGPGECQPERSDGAPGTVRLRTVLGDPEGLSGIPGPESVGVERAGTAAAGAVRQFPRAGGDRHPGVGGEVQSDGEPGGQHRAAFGVPAPGGLLGGRGRRVPTDQQPGHQARGGPGRSRELSVHPALLHIGCRAAWVTGQSGHKM